MLHRTWCSTGIARQIAACLIGAVLAGPAPAAAPTAADSPPPEVEGMLQMQLWIIIATDVPDKPYANDVFRRHIAHQVALEKQGVLFGAGPVFDTEGTRRYGLVIVRATSAEEARAIADTDPMHREGFRTYTLQRWRLNEGRLNLTIDYSDGKATVR